MKTTISAIGIMLALGAMSPARADCPNGTTYAGGVTHPVGPGGVIGLPFGIGQINGAVPQAAFDSGAQTSADCYTTGSISVGTGSAVSGVIVSDDSGTPDDPSDDTGAYLPPVTIVYGQASTAIGHGATVGRVETYNDDMGTPDDATDDVEHTRLVPVNDGTALGANSSVQHNNSTALGAGAKSTDERQVTLGTKDETIRAEGITSQKSKDRQIGPREVVTSDAGGRLATDGGQIFSTLGTHNSQIAALQDLAGVHGARLDAHSALLSQHTAQLDEQAKGLAIAMAMPDAWLSDKKRFGIFGAVGGFGDETALGFAAIGRIDETWSLNAKLGADTEFDQFGWQIGVGAQW
jgi:hypothetical protein